VGTETELQKLRLGQKDLAAMITKLVKRLRAHAKNQELQLRCDEAACDNAMSLLRRMKLTPNPFRTFEIK
jgi:hypothetical protein